MNARAFVEDLQSRGATLQADGEHLRVTPARILTNIDRAAWREHKAAILQYLPMVFRARFFPLQALLAFSMLARPTIQTRPAHTLTLCTSAAKLQTSNVTIF